MVKGSQAELIVMESTGGLEMPIAAILAVAGLPVAVVKAKRDGAQILFWDKSVFRADTVHGKTWGLRGQTPIVHRPGQRQSVSAASAVSAREEFWFCTYAGRLNGELRRR